MAFLASATKLKLEVIYTVSQKETCKLWNGIPGNSKL